jgi:hypothetical protein
MTDETKRTGKSPHAFMAEALGVQARLVDQRRAFLAAALAAERGILESGNGYRVAEVDAYFDARAAETKAPRPRLHKWRK